MKIDAFSPQSQKYWESNLIEINFGTNFHNLIS